MSACIRRLTVYCTHLLSTPTTMASSPVHFVRTMTPWIAWLLCRYFRLYFPCKWFFGILLCESHTLRHGVEHFEMTFNQLGTYYPCPVYSLQYNHKVVSSMYNHIKKFFLNPLCLFQSYCLYLIYFDSAKTDRSQFFLDAFFGQKLLAWCPWLIRYIFRQKLLFSYTFTSF